MTAAGALALTLGASAQHGTVPADFATAQDQAGRLTLQPGLHLSVWAAEPQLSNGVAFSFDPRGRAYIAETHRWNRSIFDITQKTNWLLADMAFRTVADRVAFLETQFAPTDPDLLTRDSELVRRLEDADGDGRVDRSTVFATGFNSPADGTAAGVLATGEHVYFGNIPSLWRFPAAEPPTDPPLTPGPEHRLATGFGVHVGVSGHDLHGLIHGPDGRLYMSFGDRGICVTNREGAVLDVPDCGGVLRCEPDGSRLEIFCIGLRNPQELAFDDLGNLWTVDNDTAGADPCRVLHLVGGGDYGWRTAYQHQEGFGEWVQQELWRGGQDGILPPAGTVSQGPSGLAFYPGTGFGERLAGTFLHCDFPGGVWAYTVRPEGASFAVDRREKFLWDCWPTDVEFGPDGAAYVLDWVAGWGQPMRGRIYRIAPPGLAADPVASEVRRLLADGFGERDPDELSRLLGHADRRVRAGAQEALVRRRALPALVEAATATAPRMRRLHGAWGLGQLLRTGVSADALRPHLTRLLPLAADSDDAVAGAVRGLLAGAGFPETAPLLATPPDGTSPVRWRSMLDARRMVEGHGVEVGGEQGLQALAGGPEGADPFVRHALVHVLSDRISAPGRDGAGALAGWLRHRDPRVRHVAALALRRTASPALTNLLSDPDPSIQVTAGRALHDLPVVAGIPSLAALVTRVDCPTNLLTRVIAANLRLGTPLHAQMVASLAKRRDVPGWARARALSALGDWGNPPPLDPVLGNWRPAVTLESDDDPAGNAPAAVPDVAGNPLLERARAAAATAFPGTRLTALPGLPPDLGRSADLETGLTVRRNPQGARRAFLRVGDEILNPDTPDEYGVVVPGGPAPVEVQRALLQAAVRLGAKEAAHPFFEKLTDPSTPAELRREIVPALAALLAFQTADAVRIALGDPDPGVRASAVPFLDRLEGDDAATRLAALVPPGVLPGGTAPGAADPAVVRSAVAALGRVASPGTDRLLADALEGVLDGRVAEEYRLDVLAAAGQRRDAVPAVAAALDRWERGAATADPIARWRPVLTGGDPARGAAIFFTNPQVQCSRCHQVRSEGGIVGPPLDGIAARRPAEYLLEAILEPDRAYADGFVPPEGGLSAMPAGLAELLTPLELRDVLAYLRTLDK